MTRVRSAVDIPIAAAIWGAVIIGTAALFVAPPPARLLAVAVLVPVVGFLLWIYWATYYELRPDHLYCRSGPLVERIPYDRIKSATLRSNLFSSMALSTRRIEIRQHGRGFVTGTTYISPVDREAFLSELLRRCNNLEGG
jgi:uncharacterized membrane protein YdbT with pleckstrin-like domain